MTKNDWLPPEEESPVEQARRIQKAVEVARREMEEGEYWVDISGKIWHVSDMESNHIHKVLDMLWRRCVNRATQETEHEKQARIDRVIQHIFWRDEFLDVQVDINNEEIREFLESGVHLAKDLWENLPFVQRALQVLRIRDYVYELPWERELPF